MAEKNIVLVIAHKNYQPIEYSVTKQTLENAGYAVKTASTQAGIATATDETTTEVDLTIDSIDPNQFDGLFVIGGSGTLDELNNEKMRTLLQDFASAKKPFGAICVATRILAEAGVLKGKKATGWDGDNELNGLYKEHGAHYLQQGVVVDSSIVTASGPSVAREFGENIISVLEH